MFNINISYNSIKLRNRYTISLIHDRQYSSSVSSSNSSKLYWLVIVPLHGRKQFENNAKLYGDVEILQFRAMRTRYLYAYIISESILSKNKPRPWSNYEYCFYVDWAMKYDNLFLCEACLYRVTALPFRYNVIDNNIAIMDYDKFPYDIARCRIHFYKHGYQYINHISDMVYDELMLKSLRTCVSNVDSDLSETNLVCLKFSIENLRFDSWKYDASKNLGILLYAQSKGWTIKGDTGIYTVQIDIDPKFWSDIRQLTDESMSKIAVKQSLKQYIFDDKDWRYYIYDGANFWIDIFRLDTPMIMEGDNISLDDWLEVLKQSYTNETEGVLCWVGYSSDARWRMVIHIENNPDEMLMSTGKISLWYKDWDKFVESCKNINKEYDFKSGFTSSDYWSNLR